MLSLMNQFEQFCRAQPAEETYEYMNAATCPNALFAEFIGMSDEYLGMSTPETLQRMLKDGSYPFVELEIYAATEPHTYGALADRIRDRVHDDGIFAK